MLLMQHLSLCSSLQGEISINNMTADLFHLCSDDTMILRVRKWICKWTLQLHTIIYHQSMILSAVQICHSLPISPTCLIRLISHAAGCTALWSAEDIVRSEIVFFLPLLISSPWLLSIAKKESLAWTLFFLFVYWILTAIFYIFQEHNSTGNISKGHWAFPCLQVLSSVFTMVTVSLTSVLFRMWFYTFNQLWAIRSAIDIFTSEPPPTPNYHQKGLWVGQMATLLQQRSDETGFYKTKTCCQATYGKWSDWNISMISGEGEMERGRKEGMEVSKSE